MSLPQNVHVSSHPCLKAKLSLIRSESATPRETRGLVHDIATILGVEAFAGLKLAKTGTVRILSTLISHEKSPRPRTLTSLQDRTPLGVEYETQGIDPADLALVPILRSGLGMVDGKCLDLYPIIFVPRHLLQYYLSTFSLYDSFPFLLQFLHLYPITKTQTLHHPTKTHNLHCNATQPPFTQTNQKEKP
jgi:uracil phosphoribosyltransferase